jgi:hypothetical protein
MKAQAFVSRRQAAVPRGQGSPHDARIPHTSSRGPRRTGLPCFGSSNRASARCYPRPWQWRRRGPPTVRRLKTAVSPPSRMHRRVPPGISSGDVLGSFMVVASGDAGYTWIMRAALEGGRGGVRSQFHGAETYITKLSSVIIVIITLAFNGGGLPLATSVVGASPFGSPAIVLICTTYRFF